MGFRSSQCSDFARPVLEACHRSFDSVLPNAEFQRGGGAANERGRRKCRLHQGWKILKLSPIRLERFWSGLLMHDLRE